MQYPENAHVREEDIINFLELFFLFDESNFSIKNNSNNIFYYYTKTNTHRECETVYKNSSICTFKNMKSYFENLNFITVIT